MNGNILAAILLIAIMIVITYLHKEGDEHE